MKDILEFMGNHPVLTVILIVILSATLETIFGGFITIKHYYSDGKCKKRCDKE